MQDLLLAQADHCGFNYAALEFAFGTLGHAAEMESLALFNEHVLPLLQASR
ncbi:hypothetical protein D3C83_139930 [compost metagenome]